MDRYIDFIFSVSYDAEEGQFILPLQKDVETVVLLREEKVDSHIDVDLDVGNLEGKVGTALNCLSEKEAAIMDAELVDHIADAAAAVTVTAPEKALVTERNTDTFPHRLRENKRRF